MAEQWALLGAAHWTSDAVVRGGAGEGCAGKD